MSGGMVLGSAPSASAATSYGVIATIPMGTQLRDGMGIDSANGSLYISNPGEGGVSVVDLGTNTVTTTIPVADPGRIAVDSVDHRAYVVNAGGANSLTVIDTTSNTVVDTIAGFSNPIGVAVDPSTHTVYVTNYDSEVVSVIDTTAAPATLVNTGYVGSRPWAIDVDPTTNKAYATNLFGNSVPVITGTTVTNVINGDFNGPVQLALDPIARRGYVVNGNINTVSVIDTDTEQQVGILSAGNGPTDMAVDSAAGIGYVTNHLDDSVSVIDLTDRSVIQTVSVGNVPLSVEVDPTTRRAYVMNNDDTISVINLLSSQEITFTSLTPADPSVGGSYPVTATGGASTQPVTFSVDPSTTGEACSISGSTVSFDHVGTCVIAADQAGDDEFSAASTATQEVAVELEATTTEVTLPSSTVVFGESATATAAIASASDGTVQFTLDGESVGSAVPLEPDGTATSPELTGSDLAVGAHSVGATFTPTDANRYAESSATAQTLTVDPAATTSSVSVDASSVTGTVTPVAPGAGVPTGTVRFHVAGEEVGSAELTDGTATLTYQVPTGSSRQVSATYAGDESFTGSSDSTARQDPTITATVSSTTGPRNGWYAAPVTVTFECEETSGTLTGACPAPVRLSRSAAGQSVTRTIVADDGGVGTAVVSGIDIDRIRPVARITGVRSGATYFADGPVAGCRATDRLSGVDTCTVTRTTRGRKVVYVATATDLAGNRSSARRVARTTSVAVSGASMRDGRYVVHRGRTYTVLVESKTRPTYIYAAPSPRRPAGGRIPFEQIGKDQWALGVTFKQATRHHRWWNFGTRVGSDTTVTTVRVVR